MNPKTIDSIKQKIYTQFPEVAGGNPNVRAQAGAKSPGQADTYLLTFKSLVLQPDGFAFNRSVRVVADENGRILKVTTSR